MARNRIRGAAEQRVAGAYKTGACSQLGLSRMLLQVMLACVIPKEFALPLAWAHFVSHQHSQAILYLIARSQLLVTVRLQDRCLISGLINYNPFLECWHHVALAGGPMYRPRSGHVSSGKA